MIRIRIAFILFVAGFSFGCAHSRTAVGNRREAMEDSLVRVVVIYQNHDAGLPWRKQAPGARHGYAVMVGDRHALTTENLVRNQTLVQVQRARSGEKIAARVVRADPQANLALLEIDRPQVADAAWRPLQTLAGLDDARRLDVFQFEETGQIQRGSAQTVRIAMAGLPNVAFPALTYSILTELNINGEGAAVMADDRLAGIVMAYDKNTRTGSMIPFRTLDQFYRDALNEPYKGLATAGFSWAPLVDPARRAYLEIENLKGGIQVQALLPGTSATEVLQPHDVILKIDGYEIDPMGFYDDPDFGRILFTYLVGGRREPGDMVRLDIVRRREPMTVDLRLSRYRDEQALIPENTEGEPSEYLVEGGIILRELSGDYLRAFGNNWAHRVDSRLVNLYLSRRYAPEKPGDRVVVLSIVLPDSVNVGYNQFGNSLVETVNGEAVSNLADVFRILDRDEGIERIKLQFPDIELILDRDTRDLANARVANQYRIPRLQYRRERE